MGSRGQDLKAGRRVKERWGVKTAHLMNSWFALELEEAFWGVVKMAGEAN